MHKLIFLRQASVVRCKWFGWVWVGLGHGSISSPGSGLGWVGSVIWWVGLGSVDENRPTDNSGSNNKTQHIMLFLMRSSNRSLIANQCK